MGGWWRLDEVIEPSLQQVCSRAQEVVPVAPTPIEVEAYDSDHEVLDQVTTVPRRVTRMHTTSEWYSNPVLKVMLLDNNEPMSYGEAMVGPNSDKWLEAMKSEIVSIYQNKAWTLVDLPDDRQAIEINGSFKKKTDVDGNVTVHEARLVAKSFSQVQGVDYDEFFSSVAMLKVRRNHVSISCIYEIWQMDVKTSFLTSFRKERLYAIQSEKFCRS